MFGCALVVFYVLFIAGKGLVIIYEEPLPSVSKSI